jgi:CRISPR system Cascade subunit CasB
MLKANSHAAKFVEYLVSLVDREQRGAIAALRRGVGKPPGTTPETFPIMVPWTADMDRFAADTYFLVGSLFALNQSNCADGNIGTTFAQIRGRENEASDSLEKRFVALLNADAEDLPNHLRHAVSLAASKDVAINWAQLIADLRHWNHLDRFIQRRWAEQFWGRGVEADEDQQTQTVAAQHE